MGDLRDQLAAIRPAVRQTDARAPSEATSESRRKREKRKARSSAHDDCISRLACIGEIKSYDGARGYGFISHARQSHFFHISGRLPEGRPSISEEISRRPVAFILGSSPADGRTRVVQWALLDEIKWSASPEPKTQQELDTFRGHWLGRLELQELLAVVRAGWYKGVLRGGKPAGDLVDAVLKEVLTERLKAVSPAEWLRAGVRDTVRAGRYDFLDDWIYDSEQKIPDFLLNTFTAAQLAVLGPPHYRWTSRASPEQLERLFDWALRSDLTDTQRAKWEANLEDSFPWDGALASRLLGSDWSPTGAAVDWIRRLVRTQRLDSRAIADRLDRFPSEWETWLDSLSAPAKLNVLVTRFPVRDDLVAFLESRSDPELEDDALAFHTTAVDLESDGNAIWELGLANLDAKSLLLSRTDPAERIGDVLPTLAAELEKSMLVVGHNILEWDWPILSRHLANTSNVVIWDTLLVAFLLDPWKATHALGGSHHADEDAADAFATFRDQLKRIGQRIARLLLRREIRSTNDLMRAVGQALQTAEWHPPAYPDELPREAKSLRLTQVLITPEHWTRRFDWVPNVTVISANDEEVHELEYLVITAARLSDTLGAFADDVAAITLGSLLRKAEASDISVRFNMLPLWLREHPRLCEPIRSAVSVPEHASHSLVIAPYPRSARWYTRIEAEEYVFVDPPQGLFLAEAQWLRASQLPKVVQSQLLLAADAPRAGDLHRAVVSDSPSVSLWLSLDPAARRLSKSGTCFHTFKTVDALRDSRLAIVRTSSPLLHKPELLVRDRPSLYPGAEDQCSYWTGVISGLRAAISTDREAAVAILLISSSSSRELVALIEDALVSLGWAVPYSAHQTRRERLVKAFSSGSACLVDFVDNWPAWKALSMAVGIPLTPVIEALPVFEWYAAELMEEEPDEVSSSALSEIDESDDERDEREGSVEEEENEECEVRTPRLPMRVPQSAIAARISSLIESNLRHWLSQKGFADHALPAIVLDPRVSTRHSAVRNEFAIIDSREPQWAAGQERLLEQTFEALKIHRETAPSDYESMRTFLERHWNVSKTKEDP